MSGVGNSVGSAQFGERIVHAFLNEHIDEVQALGQETILFLNGLLTSLCQRANEEAAALIAETAENQTDGEQLHGRLEELSSKLQATETESIQLKEALQEMAAEMEQRQSQYETELLAYKEEMDRLRTDLQQSAMQQQKLQQLFREDEIKFREINQQKQLLAHVVTKESHRRHLLESQLQKVQGQLVQLSIKFQTLERSHDELSQSLQSKEERIRYLNSIIQESQYVSSFSPHSNPRINDLPEQQNSYASQQLVRTLRDQQLPLIRLSQSQLPAEQSLQSISAVSIEEPQPQLLAVPKSDRTLVASESKPKKHTKAVVLSQQKATKDEGSLRKDPEKSKTVKQETKTIALSKQDPKAVKSKLTSIFRDRLTYKSQHDQIHEDTINRLKYRLREREEQIQNLNRQVSLLKVVRAEPVVVSSSSREGKREVQQLRAENESLRRITKQITMRKEYLQTQVEEFKERCAYYKSEHKKVYQKYLLKNAESVAYSEQLSEIEISYYRQRQERSIVVNEEAEDEGFFRVVPIQEPKDEFQDLSYKFNNLVLKHTHTAFNNELQEPSFKSAQGNDPRDFYTIQNIHLADISATERTLEHERKLPIKQCQMDSPAKAVLNEDTPMEDLILEGIQEIVLKQQPAGEIQTERLILSQLMQTSRRENTLTQFQILFSEHPAKQLQLVSLGCLFKQSQREKVMKIMATQSININPRKIVLNIAQCPVYTLFPKEKTSVAVGGHAQSNEIDTQTRTMEIAEYPCQVCPERVDFQQYFVASLKEISTTTDLVELKQAYTNTFSSEKADTGIDSNRIETLEQSVNTNPALITQVSINTDQVKISSSSMQTDTRQMMEICTITDTPIMKQMIDQGTAFHICSINQQTNTDIKPSIDASTNHESRHLELSPQTSLFYVPNIAPSNLTLQSDVFQHKINRGSGKLQLDLSFLNNQRSQINEKPSCDEEQLTITQKPQLRHTNAKIGAQISSCRTRCSSQDAYSNRSAHPEKTRPNKRAMRESMISQHSEGSDQPNKTEHPLCISKNTIAPTASNTPFLNKQETNLVQSRMMMEGEQAEPEIHLEKQTEKTKEEDKMMESGQVKRGPACDDQQMKIIKDYFYRMKRIQHCHAVDFTLKHEPGYNFEKNLYILETLREERQELFAIWNGRVIHFGKKIEKMQLSSPHSNCQWPSGNINMGNSEFRILGSKLQVCRREKQRLFKGDMENGEWHIQGVWAWSSN